MDGRFERNDALDGMAATEGAGGAGVAAGKVTLTGRIQRKAQGSVDASAALGALGGGTGVGLGAQTRERFEGSLGADLSGVRLHTGADSAVAAEQLGARAFTTGQDVHFGAGQYQPDDPYGMHLIAHEVAHTVQQGDARGAQAKLEVSEPGDALEVEADRAADAMVQGAPTAVSAGSVAHTIHRAAAPEAAAPEAAAPGAAAPEDAAQPSPAGDAGVTVLATGGGGATGGAGAGGGKVGAATASDAGGKLSPADIQATIGAAIPGWSKALGRDLVVQIDFAVGTSGTPMTVSTPHSIPDDPKGRDLVRYQFAQLRFPAPKPNDQGETAPAYGLSVKVMIPKPQSA